MQGDVEKATNQYYKEKYANDPVVTPIAPGWGLQDWVPDAAENGIDPNYAGWARLIGFQGPTTRDAGYKYVEPTEGGQGENGFVAGNPGYYAPKTEATPEFKQALAGYGFQQTQDKHGNGIVQMIDSNRNVIGQQRVYSGEGSFSQVIKAGMIAFIAWAVPEALPALFPAEGAAAAAALSEVGAGASVIPSTFTLSQATAIGHAVGAATQGVMAGKDLGQILENAVLGGAISYGASLATPYVNKAIGSAISNTLGKLPDVVLDLPATDKVLNAIQKTLTNVAVEGTKALITGKPYNIEDAVVSNLIGQGYGQVVGKAASELGLSVKQVTALAQFAMSGDVVKLVTSLGGGLAKQAVDKLNSEVSNAINNNTFNITPNDLSAQTDPTLNSLTNAGLQTSEPTLEELTVPSKVDITAPKVSDETPAISDMAGTTIAGTPTTLAPITQTGTQVVPITSKATEISNEDQAILDAAEAIVTSGTLGPVVKDPITQPGTQEVIIPGKKITDDELDVDNGLVEVDRDPTLDPVGVGPIIVDDIKKDDEDVVVVPPKPKVVTPKPKPEPTPAPTSSPQSAVQLSQELMNLPEKDLEQLLDPVSYAKRLAKKQKKQSKKTPSEESLMDLLETLGYRS